MLVRVHSMIYYSKASGTFLSANNLQICLFIKLGDAFIAEFVAASKAVISLEISVMGNHWQSNLCKAHFYNYPGINVLTYFSRIVDTRIMADLPIVNVKKKNILGLISLPITFYVIISIALCTVHCFS